MTEEKKEKINVDLVIKYIEEGKKILSVVSEPIIDFDDKLKELIDRLSSSLYFYEALGISAIQLGIPKRVFLIRADKDHFVPFINPEILETSEETDTQKEGCLSFPGIFIPVTRPKKIKVKYQEASGEEKIIDLEGIHARCFIHEHDHLNGVTFLDHVSNLVKESVYKKMQKAKKNGKLERDTLTLMYLEALAEDRAKEKEKNNE
jgi:peptide deformylase